MTTTVPFTYANEFSSPSSTMHNFSSFGWSLTFVIIRRNIY